MTHSNWVFVASDIDEKSLEYARENVKQNQLDHRIQLVKSQKGSILKDILPPDSKVWMVFLSFR